MSELLRARRIAEDPDAFVRGQGTVLAEFGHLTQDSGNVSWLVDLGDRRVFVKTAGAPGEPGLGAPTPYFDHAGRARLLRNAPFSQEMVLNYISTQALKLPRAY